MANKKKPVAKATEEKVNEKATKKTSVDKKNAEEKKPLDKRFIIIGAIIVAIIVGVVVFLLVSGGDDAKNPAESSTAASTADLQKENDDALWAEHNALFDELKKVYWLGEYENYKSLVLAGICRGNDISRIIILEKVKFFFYCFCQGKTFLTFQFFHSKSPFGYLDARCQIPDARIVTTVLFF